MGLDVDSELRTEIPSAVTFYKTEEIAGITPRELPDFINQPRAEIVKAVLNLGGGYINFPSGISTHEDLVPILEEARNNQEFEPLANMLQAIGVEDWVREANECNSRRIIYGRSVSVKSNYEQKWEPDSDYLLDSFSMELKITEGRDKRGVDYPTVVRTREIRMGKQGQDKDPLTLHTIVIIDRETIPDGETNSYAERITEVDIDINQGTVIGIQDRYRIEYVDPTDKIIREMDIYHNYPNGYQEAWINENNRNGDGHKRWPGGNYGGNSSYPVNYVSGIFPVDKSLEELVS